MKLSLYQTNKITSLPPVLTLFSKTSSKSINFFSATFNATFTFNSKSLRSGSLLLAAVTYYFKTDSA